MLISHPSTSQDNCMRLSNKIIIIKSRGFFHFPLFIFRSTRCLQHQNCHSILYFIAFDVFHLLFWLHFNSRTPYSAPLLTLSLPLQYFQLLPLVLFNHDYEHSAACDTLRDNVPVEYNHFDHKPASEVGQFFSAIIMVSEIVDLNIDIDAQSVAAPAL